MRRPFEFDDESGDTGVDMTPMLDIVFIMLIFFIVTTSFVKETGIDINRPQASTAVVKERGNILIAITASGDVWLDRRKVDIRAVRANVERLRAENPEGMVVIQADKQAQTGRLVQVMDQVKLAGVENISLAADN